jgi:hypothetical protein
MARMYPELTTDYPRVSEGYQEHVLIEEVSLKVFPDALMPNPVAVGELCLSVGIITFDKRPH